MFTYQKGDDNMVNFPETIVKKCVKCGAAYTIFITDGHDLIYCDNCQDEIDEIIRLGTTKEITVGEYEDLISRVKRLESELFSIGSPCRGE